MIIAVAATCATQIPQLQCWMTIFTIARYRFARCIMQYPGTMAEIRELHQILESPKKLKYQIIPWNGGCNR